jgi:NTP pyrophosphatase (non-canonical NTP hydrolase)
MELNQYQKQARETAQFITPKYLYCALGLCEEAGEVAGKIKKMIRDNNGVLSSSRRDDIIKELGDCFWYLSNVCSDIDVDLETVAKKNIEKCLDRIERNVLHGSGDNR